MVTSRLTSKGQTTIPRSIRRELNLREGDALEFELHDGFVIMRKAHAPHTDDPFATFDEWSGDADRVAYANL
jgi:antitoxin PrlF